MGFKVMKKIEQIVREEQNNIGAQEMLMPTIQSAEIWKESGRYDDYGEEMLRIQDRQGREMLYGPTNEELITDVFRSSVKSYKSLPQTLYHIQWKFRDEIRPRFGVMRGREFLMKDAYSFDLDEDGMNKSYQAMKECYQKIFDEIEKINSKSMDDLFPDKLSRNKSKTLSIAPCGSAPALSTLLTITTGFSP